VLIDSIQKDSEQAKSSALGLKISIAKGCAYMSVKVKAKRIAIGFFLKKALGHLKASRQNINLKNAFSISHANFRIKLTKVF